MLQVFRMGVAKVDRDVAMVVHVCCKCLFPIFHLFFRYMLQVCLFRYCICFTYTLQVFYLDVAYVCNVFKCFICLLPYVTSVASRCFKSKCRVGSGVAQTPCGVGRYARASIGCPGTSTAEISNLFGLRTGASSSILHQNVKKKNLGKTDMPAYQLLRTSPDKSRLGMF
jgi:hypothetical protein